MSERLPVFFVSHGGGPWPWLDELAESYIESRRWLAGLSQTLPSKPKAVVSVSGHWEADEFTVSDSPQPPMYYDYAGFPEHTYRVRYPAPGSPEIASRLRTLLDAGGIACSFDNSRGFDHGTFVPLALIFPEADVPVVQMSIKRSFDPMEHIRLGAAIAPLREEGVLILGSGLSYHNMRGFYSGGGSASRTFERWLTEVMSTEDASERAKHLVDWARAPSAREAHPREDHLIPLMVAVGAAGDDIGRRDCLDEGFGVAMASYRFDSIG